MATKKAPAKKQLSSKRQGLIDYLAKNKATTEAKAIDRAKVWKDCGVTGSTSGPLREAKLITRVDLEDGTKKFYLTPAGRKLANNSK